MKTTGMIFNGEMVQALLTGRKMQTRRPVSPQPFQSMYEPDMLHYSGKTTARQVLDDGTVIQKGSVFHASTDRNGFAAMAPCGQPGDLIYVRETWNNFDGWVDTFYAADDHSFGIGSGDDPDHVEPHDIKWKPSIHMPRWASRLTLRITDVRVERVQDISEEDAMREGVEHFDISILSSDEIELLDAPLLESNNKYRNGFALTWDGIYGTWSNNPWVWVYEFEVIHKNVNEVIKQMEAA